MSETTGVLEVDGAALAWRRIAGAGPALVWLGGFRSEMAGTKADALAAWAAGRDRDFLRFDYFGHGRSGGDFAQGTITRWRADALAILDRLTEGEVILAGSSMGGWLACLAAMARPNRIAGLILIAPAADFTGALLAPSLTDEARAAIAREGVWRAPSAYDPEGYPITGKLLEDGARWSILPGPVPITAPVRILQGGADAEVPWRHALELAQAVNGEDVVFTLVRDGDHRLSRPADLARLIAAAEDLA
ncbi:MAG TPA: alpha/beta hydrolase [Caulobacteraceae bacterium]|nr:alpha/beta hydrolase [Caulobacteraceae bacterium]